MLRTLTFAILSLSMAVGCGSVDTKKAAEDLTNLSAMACNCKTAACGAETLQALESFDKQYKDAKWEGADKEKVEKLRAELTECAKQAQATSAE